MGIEAYGIEYSFQCVLLRQGDPQDETLTGLVMSAPGKAEGYIYKETLNLGTTPLSLREVNILLSELAEQWLSKDYHPINHNCVDFARSFIARLQIPQESLPCWVSGACDYYGQSFIVCIVADGLLSFAKLWT